MPPRKKITKTKEREGVGRATRSTKKTSTIPADTNTNSTNPKTTSKQVTATRKTRSAGQKKTTANQLSSNQDDSDFNAADTDDSDDSEDCPTTDASGLRTQHNHSTSTTSAPHLPIDPLSQTTHNNKEDNGNKGSSKTTIFRSRFPGLEMESFENCLDDWTVVELRQTIAKQGATSSRASTEIRALVKSIRLEYEKRMLMAALMGGVPEAVVWKIVGEGSKRGHANPWIRFLAFGRLALEEKLPPRGDKEEWGNRNQRLANIWKGLSKDQKTVFKDPYFFALANLPDLSNLNDEESDEPDTEDFSFQHLDASTPAPKVHQLDEAERLKYLPIYNELVDIPKLHLCHGRPEPTSSVATLQKKSLAELRKAHHNFAVVCQRYQITYYLTAVSCGSTEGWSQVFSNNTAFAQWAMKDAKVPCKFSSYIHGKSISQEIEGAKYRQPSDERRTQLVHRLNSLVGTVSVGNIFPKVPDPQGEMDRRGWGIRIVQKDGSLLSEDALKQGHRAAKDATIRLWLKDIEEKRFVIEVDPDAAEKLQAVKDKKTKKRKRSRKSASPEFIYSSNNEDDPTQTQPQQKRSNHNQTRVTSQGYINNDNQPNPRQKKTIDLAASQDSSEEEQDNHRINQKSSDFQSHQSQGNHHSNTNTTVTSNTRADLDGLPMDDGACLVL
ncbi:hypothetical protein DFH28DRAFT_890079 [Melampsora americana]|nr:hypothetical protein DFH28DRAFT_890079 [Melampsora americana]